MAYPSSPRWVRAGKGNSGISEPSFEDAPDCLGEKKDLIFVLAVLMAHLDALAIVTAPIIESAPMVKTKHGCHLLGSDFLKNI